MSGRADGHMKTFTNQILRVFMGSSIHHFKKDDPTIFSNYRPISLLPAVSKVFEKAVFAQVYSFLQENKLLFPGQYGFRSLHSTELAATELVDKIYDDFYNGGYLWLYFWI